MHTVMVVAGGFALLGLCLLAGRLSGAGMAVALLWFLPLWLVGAAINMWVGVSRAGYPVSAELPIFLLVFAIPAASALLLRWALLRG